MTFKLRNKFDIIVRKAKLYKLLCYEKFQF